MCGIKSVVSVQVALKANLAPTIEALPPVAVSAGGSVEVQIVADDVDDDNSTLRYVLQNAPKGMEVSADGLIRWTVDSQSETVVHSVTVIVLDGDNAMGKQILEVSVTGTAITLVSSPTVVGPFETEADAVIDEAERTITVARSGGMRFYKLQPGGNTKLKITSIAIQGDNVVMNYEPAGE